MKWPFRCNENGFVHKQQLHHIPTLEVTTAAITVPTALNLRLSKLHLLIIHISFVSRAEPIRLKLYIHLSLPLLKVFVTGFIQVFFVPTSL